jgi:hypothetical protein
VHVPDRLVLVKKRTQRMSLARPTPRRSPWWSAGVGNASASERSLRRGGYLPSSASSAQACLGCFSLKKWCKKREKGEREQCMSHRSKKNSKTFNRSRKTVVFSAATDGSYRAVRFASPSWCRASPTSYISATTRFSSSSLPRQRVTTVST